jgi:predicted ArsR family transcriptional regulator
MSTKLLDLLSDPARLAIVRALAERQPAALEEIAAGADVHDNTARAHIAELEESGAVKREHVRTGRPGRPQVVYRLSEAWQLPSSDMRGLAELLAALALRLAPAPGQLNDFGRQWGRYLAGRPGSENLDSLPLELERLGFDSKLEGAELRLTGCPCPLIAPESPALVCALITAVVDGLAEAATGQVRVASSAHDPARRRCTIALSARRRRGSHRRPRGSDRSTATKGEPAPLEETRSRWWSSRSPRSCS